MFCNSFAAKTDIALNQKANRKKHVDTSVTRGKILRFSKKDAGTKQVTPKAAES